MKRIFLDVGCFLSTLLLPAIGSATPSSTATANGKQPDALFNATEWKTCEDMPQLQCREVTVPRFYTPTKVIQGKAEGTFVNLERRLVKGKPTRHIWLLQGG